MGNVLYQVSRLSYYTAFCSKFHPSASNPLLHGFNNDKLLFVKEGADVLGLPKFEFDVMIGSFTVS